jgi:hypothetical protein
MPRGRVKRHRPCQVCHHPDRQRIELARLTGMSCERVASKFKVHRDAIWRHMPHLEEGYKAQLILDLPIQALARQAAEENASLMDYLGICRGVLMKQLLLAADDRDRTGTAALAGRILDYLKEIGKITGEISNLASLTQVNNTAIFVGPQFADIQTMLIERLRAYPEALASVVEGLQELEARAVPEGLTGFGGRPPAVIEHQGNGHHV